MSVYIKGMEMPKNCIACEFGIDGWCHRQNHFAYVEVEKRRDDCPLIPVPPHGRLIDADALFDFILNIYKTAQGDARKAYRDVLDTIVAAGDIIPAEEGET